MARPINYPLTHFSNWMISKGSAAATVAVYLSRVRSVLSSMKCPPLPSSFAPVAPSISPPVDESGEAVEAEPQPQAEYLKTLADFVNDEEAVLRHLGEVGLGTSVQTTTAWRMFADWLAEQGIEATYLTSQLRHAGPRGFSRSPQNQPQGPTTRESVIVPHPPAVQMAIFQLYLLSSKAWSERYLTGAGLLAKTWNDVTFSPKEGAEGFAGAYDAYSIRLGNADSEWAVYFPNVNRGEDAWKVLWTWARGDKRHPLYEQPLIPLERGGGVPIEFGMLTTILARGKAGRLAPIMPEDIDSDPGECIKSYKPYVGPPKPPVRPIA